MLFINVWKTANLNPCQNVPPWMRVSLVGAWFLAFPAIAQEPTTASQDANESVSKIVENEISESDREHWAFRPISRPEIPKLSDESWVRNEIDHFVLDQMAEKGLQPQNEASRRVLIRRLTFDLTGLPPTPQEVKDFVNDRSDAAYEKLVERLLASQGYGVHWAQHWLDLARYAETDGFEHDKVRANAWKYRDWVVDALNRDVPYDRFLTLQLAGDEVEPDDEKALTATYFCVAGPDMPDINLMEERRHNLLNEMTSTISEVFMGLTMGCAQCHDHKFDPVSQADFYRMRAFFEGSVDLVKNQSLQHLKEDKEKMPESYIMERGDFRRKGAELDPQFVRVVNFWDEKTPEDRTDTVSTGRRTAFANWLTDKKNPLTRRVMVNRIWQQHFGQGLSISPSNFGYTGFEPTHPQLLDWLCEEFSDHGWSIKALHRKIVNSATYRQSSRPGETESEQQRWQKAIEEDPRNELLARFTQRRLTGEIIRDAMLSVSGSLNPELGGPSVRPELPNELTTTLLKNQWKTTEDEIQCNKRSLYVFARRNLRYPIFEAFDRPNANVSCPQRHLSTTAPQSLLLLNSNLSLKLARQFAGQVGLENKDRKSFIIECYLRAFSRSPLADELRQLDGFLERQSEMMKKGERAVETLAMPIPEIESLNRFEAAARTDLCLALLNSNEFVYVD